MTAALEFRLNHIDPIACQLLWCNVLSVCWEDALDPPVSLSHRRIADARDWFGTSDFYRVCQWAGVDADDILSRYRAAASSEVGYQSARRTGIAA